jgi:hypothetical protein
MSIRRPDYDRKREINLDGPDGNAFVLLGYASRYADQLGLDKDAILKEMKSGNYRHLVETFDKHFGEFVDLIWSGMPDVTRIGQYD